MADVLTIGAHTVTQVAGVGWMWNGAPYNATLDRCVPIVKGGIPELHFSRILPKLTTLPDVWSAQLCTLTCSGTLIFSGSVVGYVDRFMSPFGWVREYRALGLRNLADYVANTDPETLTDTSVFNLPGDDPNFIGSCAGLTVGAIVTQILIGATNAAALHGYGIGAYTSLGPPAVLPSLTVSDLAALTVIPPCAWPSPARGSCRPSRPLFRAVTPIIGCTCSPMAPFACWTCARPRPIRSCWAPTRGWACPP